MFNELIINWLCEKIGSVDWETLWALEQNLNKIYILHSWISDPSDPSNPSNMMFTWWVKAILDIDRYKVFSWFDEKMCLMLKKGSAAYFMRNFTHGITNIWEELYKNIFAFPEPKQKKMNQRWMDESSQRRGLYKEIHNRFCFIIIMGFLNLCQ